MNSTTEHVVHGHAGLLATCQESSLLPVVATPASFLSLSEDSSIVTARTVCTIGKKTSLLFAKSLVDCGWLHSAIRGCDQSFDLFSSTKVVLLRAEDVGSILCFSNTANHTRPSYAHH